jgi:hypothetical protein
VSAIRIQATEVEKEARRQKTAQFGDFNLDSLADSVHQLSMKMQGPK